LVAGSLFAIDSGAAEGPLPLPPTPACHDGHDATLAQTEGPYLKASSPERIELFCKTFVERFQSACYTFCITEPLQ